MCCRVERNVCQIASNTNRWNAEFLPPHPVAIQTSVFGTNKVEHGKNCPSGLDRLFFRISEVGTTFRISSCSWRLLRVILYRETLQGSECAGAQKGKTTTALSIHCPFCEKKTTLAPKKEQKINSKKKHCQPKRNFYDWQSSSTILYSIHSSGESLQYSVH